MQPVTITMAQWQKILQTHAHRYRTDIVAFVAKAYMPECNIICYHFYDTNDLFTILSSLRAKHSQIQLEMDGNNVLHLITNQGKFKSDITLKPVSSKKLANWKQNVPDFQSKEKLGLVSQRLSKTGIRVK